MEKTEKWTRPDPSQIFAQPDPTRVNAFLNPAKPEFHLKKVNFVRGKHNFSQFFIFKPEWTRVTFPNPNPTRPRGRVGSGRVHLDNTAMDTIKGRFTIQKIWLLEVIKAMQLLVFLEKLEILMIESIQ